MAVILHNNIKMDFKNKNILVIGGSSGIGRGIADCFKKYNANVCITGTRESINDYEEDISKNISKCEYRKLDLSNHENLKDLKLPFCLLYTSDAADE